MKKRKIVFWLVCIYIIFTQFSTLPIKGGILNLHAYWKADKENNLVVYEDEFGFYYRDGLHKKYVTLTGNSPCRNLSNRLIENRFLLTGEFDEELHAFYGKEFFRVDKWDIIVPIKRVYNDQYDRSGRWFYPWFYIDEIDAENNDFEVVSSEKFVTTFYEAAYLKKQYSNEYFIITPITKNNNIEWHIVEGDVVFETDVDSTISEESIRLTGNKWAREKLNDLIVSNAGVINYADHFLIKGIRQIDKSIEVESWQIIVHERLKVDCEAFGISGDN